MSTLQSPRGTRDILPLDQPLWNYVKQAAVQTAESMGYQAITIPTYEEIQLFQRAIGEGTDIQDKELFLVRGKQGEESYALRPEATAGVVRAFIQHGMHTWPQPVKLYTFVNNFRYDRPQKGRYREHVQFGVEYFGDTGPFADAWVIYTGWHFLKKLGLEQLVLKLNSLGTKEERARYCTALVEYFSQYQSQLSPDSQKRLIANPLRILDSKDPADRELCRNAPQLNQFFSMSSQEHFTQVQSYLKAWDIPIEIDPFLVRGLDYYCHTAFEWTINNQEGQQDSLGGGGRYDGLVSQLGGPETGAVGYGIGLDRVVEELTRQGKNKHLKPNSPLIYLIAADPEGKAAIPHLVERLLQENINLDLNLSKESLASQMKSAAKSGARYALLLGKLEVENNSVTLKDLGSSQQEEVKQDQLVERLLNA